MKVEIRTRLPFPHDMLNKLAQAPYQHLWAFGNQGATIWTLWEKEGYRLTVDTDITSKPIPFTAIIVRQEVEVSLLRLLKWYLRKWLPAATLQGDER